MFNSPDEVLRFIKDEGVEFVDVRFTDLPGVQQHFNTPAQFVDEDLFVNGLMFDGSSIRGFKRIEQSDMYFLPDPNTYAVLPWRGTDTARTARLICDVADPDGQPFAGDPRTNLRRVLRQAADLEQANEKLASLLGKPK